MKNSVLCEMFVNGAENGKGNSMKIEGNRLYSYNACICKRYDNGNGSYSFVMDVSKYSVTTSRHQYYLMYALRNKEVEEVNARAKGNWVLGY